ncbi:hypothetical protein GAO09_02920 [Rhizobiales bacterium RZME27]|uniref:Xylulose 5-phosphate/Fructose 6-phosphate phosphoketolase N-terminal domain-containing protein n=1 Tax=Endobacterium cereale TaxID=2663029 RepID=A0A6A8A6X7_9HYPH|nr:hypothetical protein [Endobacterium cereale]MQY45026.1 hypothetical protein [Endobacterium cereale]
MENQSYIQMDVRDSGSKRSRSSVDLVVDAFILAASSVPMTKTVCKEGPLLFNFANDASRYDHDEITQVLKKQDKGGRQTRRYDEHLFRQLLDSVVGKPHAITACLIDTHPSSGKPSQKLLQWREFVDPARDGAVLPIVRIRASMCAAYRGGVVKLENALTDNGYLPFLIKNEGNTDLNEKLRAKIGAAFELIGAYQKNARRVGSAFTVPQWPAIVLMS